MSIVLEKITQNSITVSPGTDLRERAWGSDAPSPFVGAKSEVPMVTSHLRPPFPYLKCLWPSFPLICL